MRRAENGWGIIIDFARRGHDFSTDNHTSLLQMEKENTQGKGDPNEKNEKLLDKYVHFGESCEALG